MSDPRAAVEILPLYPHFTEVEKRKSSSCWGRTQVAPNTAALEGALATTPSTYGCV